MVTREYSCPSCGQFEVRQPITEDVLSSCPTCQAEVKQVFSRPAEVIWKGSLRWMKGNPEVDMDKIDAEQNAAAHKEAMKTVAKGLEQRPQPYFGENV